MSSLIDIRRPAEITRRAVLKLLAAGLGAGCLTRPGADLVATERSGTAVQYSTALLLDGFATRVSVTARDGRPIKLDGLAGSTPITQARILDLYDPQRLSVPTPDWQPELPERGPVWLIMSPQSSPTVGELIERLRTRCELHVCWYAPLDRRAVYRGHQLAYGETVEHDIDLTSEVIALLDAELANARPFFERRPHNRLWVCEPMPTPTGTLADERLALRAGDIVALAVCVLERLRGPVPREIAEQAARRLGAHVAWAHALADDLARHRGTILVGDRQPAAVHALGRWIDHMCGRRRVHDCALLDPLGGEPLDAIRDPALAIVIDANPVYARPALADVLGKTRSLYAGLWPDETSAACRARVPLAHDLETWSDPRTFDGAVALAQQVVMPRFEVTSPIELLAMLTGAHADVRTRYPTWRDTLARGEVAGVMSATRELAPRWTPELEAELVRTMAPPGKLEIDLSPSQIHDGRFAGNAWLQELPHPITKQVWGNAALMSPATAGELDVDDGDLVRIATSDGHIDLPALGVPGHCDGAITVELGYGRRALPIADGVGANASLLGTTRVLAGAATKAHGRARVIRTQHHMAREREELAPSFVVGEPLDLVARLRGDEPSLLPERPQVGWAMTIDTSRCTGCSACMVACQAENNIPSIGADECARDRHMNWIRIDRYVADSGDVVNQPMPCQHCETAPCEYVCPVGATVHSPDGLNEQVYNRCVGTRFCSNNCPYKVRRFNWFAYESNAAQHNPEVTVRDRGVMEKCTYCVQRIRGAEIRARVEHRAIRRGEVTTACQDACPTAAIQFGRLGDEPIASLRRDPRRYDALHHLGTRPRTQYLAKIRNPRGRK